MHAMPEPEVLAESRESTCPALRALLSFKKVLMMRQGWGCEA